MDVGFCIHNGAALLGLIYGLTFSDGGFNGLAAAACIWMLAAGCVFEYTLVCVCMEKRKDAVRMLDIYGY